VNNAAVAPCGSSRNRQSVSNRLTLPLARVYFFYPKDGGDTFLRNVRLYNTHTAPHHRRRHLHSHRRVNLKSYIIDRVSTIYYLVVVAAVAAAAAAASAIRPTSGRRSVGIVRSRTQTLDFCFCLVVVVVVVIVAAAAAYRRMPVLEHSTE
jgi:hypothetical protein